MSGTVRGWTCTVMLAVFSGGLFGCQTTGGRLGPNEIDPLAVKTHDDIVSIVAMTPSPPWLQTKDGRPVGFQLTAYFVSSETERGVFVSRPIHIWIDEVVRGERGFERQYLHGWQFTAKEAEGFRVRKKSIMGYPYLFPLVWPDDMDPYGKRIEINVAFERPDGRMITRTPKQAVVPYPQGYRRERLRQRFRDLDSEPVAQRDRSPQVRPLTDLQRRGAAYSNVPTTVREERIRYPDSDPRSGTRAESETVPQVPIGRASNRPASHPPGKPKVRVKLSGGS